MADQAQLVVDRNGLNDVVQIINAKMEDITLPEQVDVIISEVTFLLRLFCRSDSVLMKVKWMGSFLVFESMLETVLFARDRWLKEGGKMYPAIARMFVAPLDMTSFFNKRIKFMRSIPDVNMSPLMYVLRHITGSAFGTKLNFRQPFCNHRIHVLWNARRQMQA